jgi:serine/threonine protein kinase
VDDCGSAQVCDFGRAKVIGTEDYQTELLAGYASYMAPELFPDDERIVDDLYTPSSDIYAFGMLSFEVRKYLETRSSCSHHGLQVFTDEVPFSSFGALSQYRVIANVVHGVRPSRSSNKQLRISDNMWEIIQDCWVADPTVRPTAVEILQRIS